jgi:PiT family inorganic phosphate transporter
MVGPPPLWIRSLLLLTCTGVSFSHGTNDGQKSIRLSAFLFHLFS